MQHQNPATYLFRAVLSCKRCLSCADFSPDSDQNTSSLEEALLWIHIWVKNVLMLGLFQLLSSPDVNWWTVDYCDVFIRLSFWRHPFTAEHPLLRHISTNLMKKQTHPDLECPEDEWIFRRFSFLAEVFLSVPERKVMSAKAHGVLILVLCSSECRAVRMWCRSVSARSSNTTRRFAWLLFRCTSWHSAPNKRRKSRWNTSSECLTFMSVLTIIKGVVQTTNQIVWSWF